MMRNKNICTLVLFLLTASLAFADGRGIPAFDDYVKVENDDQAIVGMGNTIKTIEHHARSSGYVVRGLIRYNVEGRGIALLQIRSTPLDNLSTRSMNDFVMTQKLLGTSQQNYGTDEFRQFYLYFHRGSGKPETVLTSISVWLHGKGTVELADLRVDDVAYATGEWWNSRESGLVGAWMGIGLGCFYVGLFCTLYLLLVPRGKGRQLLTGILLFMPIMGTAMLLFGISAWYLGQPWHVWYPFLSCGFICCILWIFPYRETMAKYNEFDQRRMQALDM